MLRTRRGNHSDGWTCSIRGEGAGDASVCRVARSHHGGRGPRPGDGGGGGRRGLRTCDVHPARSPGLLSSSQAGRALAPRPPGRSWPLRWSSPAGMGVASLPLSSLFASGIGGFYFL